jgi:hypothetical protein
MSDAVLYAIRHKHGMVKVGVSKDPERRLETLQSSCPYQLKLLTTVRTEDAYLLESVLHNQYGKWCYRGEWFELPDKIVQELVDKDFIDAALWAEVLEDG